jgi:hypothetical protein
LLGRWARLSAPRLRSSTEVIGARANHFFALLTGTELDADTTRVVAFQPGPNPVHFRWD